LPAFSSGPYGLTDDVLAAVEHNAVVDDVDPPAGTEPNSTPVQSYDVREVRDLMTEAAL
jgi:hypothetical protein